MNDSRRSIAMFKRLRLGLCTIHETLRRVDNGPDEITIFQNIKIFVFDDEVTQMISTEAYNTCSSIPAVYLNLKALVLCPKRACRRERESGEIVASEKLLPQNVSFISFHSCSLITEHTVNNVWIFSLLTQCSFS